VLLRLNSRNREPFVFLEEEVVLTPDKPSPREPTREAFAAAVDEYWSTIYRLLYCSTGHAQEAEDLAQETFLRAWHRLDTFEPGTAMGIWLLRIAANAATDVRRRRRRLGFGPLEHDPPGRHVAPGHALDPTEQVGLLKVAMEQLSEMTRMVFHLRAQEGLSLREIAELVGTTEQGARQHMHLARTRLLKQMAEKP
jgi:RNA polymerase sigma-70 factor (ECF subfamily)